MVNKENTILIVDDNSNNLKVVAGVLKGEGYEFRMAKSGAQALSILEISKPDLILLDIQMPEMDGYETCKRIKQNNEFASIPIIFLTANTDAESISKAFKSGGVDFITKPFNSDELLARIATHIQLKTQKEALEYEIKTKNKFFSIISHDLKNPLTTVIGFAELLDSKFDEIDEDKIKKFIHYIHESSKFSVEILEDLLTWSRIQGGTLKSERTKCNLSSLLNSNIEGHIPQAIAKNINLKYDFDQNLPVCADENMISTVIRNLISNAIKFTPMGGEIFVSSKEKIINDIKIIETEISDTGVGMSYEQINKLFKIENNVNSKGTNNETGTGLGLVLCKEFLSQNDGEIRVESELKVGSKFIFNLAASA